MTVNVAPLGDVVANVLCNGIWHSLEVNKCLHASNVNFAKYAALMHTDSVRDSIMVSIITLWL